MGLIVNQTGSNVVIVPPPPATVLPNVLFMVGDESPGRTTLSAKDGKRKERCACPFAAALNTQMAMLGYSYTTSGSRGYTLNRVVPMRHPLYTSYYCTQIDDEYGLQFAGTYSSPSGGGNAGVLPTGAAYTYSIFDATFEPSRIYYAPDADALPEYERFVSYDYEGKAELLERPFGQMVFSEGPGNGKPYQGRASTIERKVDFTVTWWQVPEDWVSSNGVGAIGFPNKIYACIGALNSTTIWGFPAGTLLMQKPKILRYPAPLLLANAGNLPQQTFYLDIQLNFSWFDPPPGTGAQRGWNNKPWFADSSGSALQYYRAVVPGTSEGTFPLADFTAMFTNVNS